MSELFPSSMIGLAFSAKEMSSNSLADSVVIQWAIIFVAVVIAFSSVWLQWWHFKKSCPPASPKNTDKESSYRRWRTLYWREVRATFFLAFVSLCMVGMTIVFIKEISLLSLTSLLFWIGMFFYNLWLAQWYAWRISTKRRR